MVIQSGLIPHWNEPSLGKRGSLVCYVGHGLFEFAYKSRAAAQLGIPRDMPLTYTSLDRWCNRAQLLGEEYGAAVTRKAGRVRAIVKRNFERLRLLCFQQLET